MYRLLAVAALVSVAFAGKRECLSVTGRVSCRTNGDEAKFIKVVLLDENTMARDTIMDTGYTARSGSFYLYGCSSDTFGDIDPQLRIYHKCGTERGEELIHEIDRSFIGKEFSAGTVELSAYDQNKFSKKNYNHDVHIPCTQE